MFTLDAQVNATEELSGVLIPGGFREELLICKMSPGAKGKKGPLHKQSEANLGSPHWNSVRGMKMAGSAGTFVLLSIAHALSCEAEKLPYP